MRSHLFSPSSTEPTGTWAVHQKKMLRVVVDPAHPLMAAKGTMVAYQGTAEFAHTSGGGGFGGMLKRAVSTDNTPLMQVTGNAEVFLASLANDVHLIELEGDSVCVNGRSLLAFQSSLSYDLRLNKGAGFASGGVWSTFLSGQGMVAVVADGTPLLLETGKVPTYTDTDATIAWGGHMTPGIKSSMNMKSMFFGGSGEAFQYAFNEPGWVLVQPSEGPPPPPTSNTSNSTSLGSLFS